MRDESTSERIRTIRLFWDHLSHRPDLVAAARDPERGLRGWNLACACRLDQICHADVWLAIANGDETLAALQKRWERDVAAGRLPFGQSSRGKTSPS